MPGWLPISAEWIVLAVLAAALVLFVWGRWRYDLVAVGALLVLAATGIVPADGVFTGFGHPAVITVAAVLVLSRGLINAGVVGRLSQWLGWVGEHTALQVLALCGLVAVTSAFINNVGALALLMPVAIQVARKSDRSPRTLLMPIAFASLLGGMMTLIGTPPNILVASFRARTGDDPFLMFDFTPVGLAVAVAGVAFLALGSWRLLPRHEGAEEAQDPFRIEGYVSELRVPEKAEAVGKRLGELPAVAEGAATVPALIRDERTMAAPSGLLKLRPDDLLIVHADAEALESLTQGQGLDLEGEGSDREGIGEAEDVSIVEAVVTTHSPMIGETAQSLALRGRHGLNLLAISRHGARLRGRIPRTRFRPGDVLMLQGSTEGMADALTVLGCLPLAQRDLQVGRPRRLVQALGIFAAALVLAAGGWLAPPVAFGAAAAAMIVTGLVPLREAYESIDLPVIVLIAAMLPVGQAWEATGGAGRMVEGILWAGSGQSPVLALALVLVATMLVSDLVNNAAAVILMAPVALDVARILDASADPFLMAVAIGGSCAFLTPIGHQSNTLVMSPGGYRFGDFWRMGLPLEVLVVAVALPMLLWVWPL